MLGTMVRGLNTLVNIMDDPSKKLCNFDVLDVEITTINSQEYKTFEIYGSMNHQNGKELGHGLFQHYSQFWGMRMEELFVIDFYFLKHVTLIIVKYIFSGLHFNTISDKLVTCSIMQLIKKNWKHNWCCSLLQLVYFEGWS